MGKDSYKIIEAEAEGTANDGLHVVVKRAGQTWAGYLELIEQEGQ